MATDTEPDRRSARRRIIEDAQLACHVVRGEFQQRKLHDGTGESIAPEFQQAVLDYYWSLRPLRDEDPVRDWWDDVELSSQWEQEKVVDTRYRQSVDETGTPEIVEVPVKKTLPVTGLESLRAIDGQTETTKQTKTTMAGTKRTAERRPRVLAPEILVDVSGVLDDAAAKLGFTPDVDSIDHTDEVTEEDLEELFESGGEDEGDEDGPEVEVTDTIGGEI